MNESNCKKTIHGYGASIILNGTIQSSKSFDTFSSWLLAGVGGAISLLLSNADKLNDLLLKGVMDKVLTIFGCLIIIVFIERMLSIGVSGLAAVTETILNNSRAEPDDAESIEKTLKEIEQATLHSTQILIGDKIKKALSGDYSGLSSAIAYLVQIQGIFSFTSVVLVVYMVYVLSGAFTI